MKKDWEYKKLGDICTVTDYVSNGSFASLKENVKYYYEPNYAILVRLADSSNNFNVEKFVYTDKHGYDFCTKSHLFGGELIMSNVGSVGAMFICPQLDKPMTLAPNTIAINSENNLFLYYYFQSSCFTEKLKAITSSATLKKFNKTNFKQLVLNFPPLSEQKEIVEYLDSSFAKIDKLKENAAKNLEEAKALFQSALKDALEPKEGWEENKLQEVALDFSRGKSKHRPRNDKRLFGGQYPFIQTGEIRNANVYVTSHSSTYNEMGLSQSKLWPEDTVCITIAANIAEVAILKYPCCFPDSVIGFVADRNKVDKKFVYFSLLNYQQELKKQGKGSAQDNINLGTFEKNTFPFPPLSEQQSIVSFLDSLNEKVNTLQQNYSHICDECDALKQAILRQVFE